MGGAHPEAPQRLAAVEDELLAAGLDRALRRYEAPRATREQLLRVHDAGYVEALFAQAPREGLARIDSDTAMNPYTLEAALRAAGAVIQAVDLVVGREASRAFCNVRPPGHHAERRRAMGFCFFNNVAVGAAHALAEHGLSRVAIADFDVHHGNGTEDIFGDEPRVLFCSTFQHPFYPYTGTEARSKRMVSVPLAAGTGGEGFRAAVREHWLPALEGFEPQLILVSAGFDAHGEDPLAGLYLTEDDFAWVTQALGQLAGRYAAGRMVSSLEGGYALPALGRSAVAHIKAMLE